MRQGEIRAEQIAHRTLFIPLPVQPPLAAGVDQAVGDQRLQHVQPPCPLPRRRQPGRPEVIQPQLIPHMAGQPAGAPLPRPVQPQTAQPDMHHIAVQCRCLPILGEQRDLSGLLAVLVKRLNRPAPRRALAVIDLAQIQHMPLHRPPARHPAVLHDAPVAVLLAVLPANLVAQKHAPQASKPRGRFARDLVGTARGFRCLPQCGCWDFQGFTGAERHKISEIVVQLRKSG